MRSREHERADRLDRMPPAGSPDAIARPVARARRRPDETPRAIEAEFLLGSLICRVRDGGDRGGARERGSSRRSGACDAARRAAALRAASGSGPICRSSAQPKLRAAQEHRHRRRSRTTIRRCANGCSREQERVCALIARRRAVETRERTAALVTIAAEVLGALSRREEPPRPARLRRPDRQDAAPARRANAPHGCTTSSTSASTTC